MCEWVDLDVLRPCHTGGLTSNFAPGVGKLTVSNTWLVLSSPMPVILHFLQVAEKKLQLALCGSNLPTLLEFVKPHSPC